METKVRADDLINKMECSCSKLVPVYSEGIWNLKPGENILRHSLLSLYVQLALIFIITSLIHHVLRRHQLPRLVSEVLAGLILGPTVMGHFWPNMSLFLFPPESVKILYTLTRFGYVFFMFMIGVKMDVNLILKSRKREWYIGGSHVINLAIVATVVSYIHTFLDHQDDVDDWIAFFQGTLMMISFPVVASFLMNLKIINSELGHIALSAALVCDLQGAIIINSLNYVKVTVEASLRAALKSMVLTVTLTAFVTIIGRQFFFWIIRRTPEGKPVKNGYIIFIVFIVLVLAIAGENVGFLFLYAPFIFGLVAPTGPPLASTLVHKLDTVVSGFFLPLTATYSGFKSNLWEIREWPSYTMVFAMTFGLVAKMVSVFIPAVCSNMHARDAAVLSLIMSAKGITELGVFIYIHHKLTTEAGRFTIAVMLTFVIATILPLLVRQLHDSSRTNLGYKQRNILHSVSKDDFRILVCTHRLDDALAAIRLLEVSHPTKESPLSVFGLYLEPLIGGSTPLLINHQLGQKASNSDASRWQPIIHLFKYFKAEHPRFVQVQVFTAISLPKIMHEDICLVAFEKSVSLIILPCHRIWSAGGELISDSQALRTLNYNVMNRAPSSVGIFLDRSKIRGPSSIFVLPSVYRVAMLYMGGEDDMEALAYAKRMARCSRVQLTVIYFVLPDDCEQTRWKSTLVGGYLNALRKKDEILGELNIAYKEQIVRDGVDTAVIIQSMGQNYDLVLMGRRHQDDSPITSGLSEWCELPELGPVGDIFASSDIISPVSVLVIQQQIIQK